jgi:glycosyltransferase involved in cell wall biosynthesis
LVSDPLISILVPCYNAAAWIGPALRSAREQSWRNWEIIVVDDGSTDRSFEIAREFAGPNCQVLPQERGGASAARNAAYAAAQGDFIQYLDADDLLAPDKLERQMQAVRSSEPGLLSFSSALHFFETPEGGERHFHPARLGPGGGDPREFLIDLWIGAGMVQTGQWLSPRALIEKAGAWNEELSVDDDGEFFARLVLAANRIEPVPAACIYYRKFRNGRNLSASAGVASRMRAAQLKSTYLLARGFEARAEEAVRRLITREIVAAYPAFSKASAEGLDFLRQRGLEMAKDLEGSPWFRRLYPIIGWKAARWMQWHRSRNAAGELLFSGKSAPYRLRDLWRWTAS